MSKTSIAFYAPLKPIDHPVPSGDRLMAQMLADCLEQAGYRVEIASRMRAFFKESEDYALMKELEKQANREIVRLSKRWTREGPPALWFCYHPYFKSPDLIGPRLCALFKIPYVTAEASWSPRRGHGLWAHTQQLVLSAIENAAINICFTERDEVGIAKVLPQARLTRMSPFIDTTIYSNSQKRTTDQIHLVSVAMMRAGDKFNSYQRLASALEKLLDKPWILSLVGDGARQSEVKALFACIPDSRITWCGRLARSEIARLFSSCSLYVWPGCGEAYGLAYLEAQAAGLPVVAYNTAGVPEVVKHGCTGILTPVGDDEAFARAIADLLKDPVLLNAYSDRARDYVLQKHSRQLAGKQMMQILQSCLAS